MDGQTTYMLSELGQLTLDWLTALRLKNTPLSMKEFETHKARVHYLLPVEKRVQLAMTLDNQADSDITSVAALSRYVRAMRRFPDDGSIMLTSKAIYSQSC